MYQDENKEIRWRDDIGRYLIKEIEMTIGGEVYVWKRCKKCRDMTDEGDLCDGLCWRCELNVREIFQPIQQTSMHDEDNEWLADCGKFTGVNLIALLTSPKVDTSHWQQVIPYRILCLIPFNSMKALFDGGFRWLVVEKVYSVHLCSIETPHIKCLCCGINLAFPCSAANNNFVFLLFNCVANGTYFTSI